MDHPGQNKRRNAKQQNSAILRRVCWASRCSDMQPLALAPGKALLAPLQSNVLIVYTGGTIGMQPGSDGALKPCKGFLTDMIPKMDELLRPGMPLTTGPSLPSQR